MSATRNLASQQSIVDGIRNANQGDIAHLDILMMVVVGLLVLWLLLRLVAHAKKKEDQKRLKLRHKKRKENEAKHVKRPYHYRSK